MLADIIKEIGLPSDFWARVAGSSNKQFEGWLSGKREIPRSIAEELAVAIGVPVESVLEPRRLRNDEVQKQLPPLWLKAREKDLGESETMAIAVTRRLASHYLEVLELLGPIPDLYRELFEATRLARDVQAPSAVQGSSAASAFLAQSELGHGAKGIGEILRGYIRSIGVMLLETPIGSAKLEGFCLPVGPAKESRPCIVVNSYRTTWFRRNFVMLHELAHAIFDLDAVSAVFDVEGKTLGTAYSRISEERARSFALHVLLPNKLLCAIENQLKPFREMDDLALARAVAFSHAEQGTLVGAAEEAALLSKSDADRLRELDIAGALRDVSAHSRSLNTLKPEEVISPETMKWGARKTTFPLKGYRLPIPLVKTVMASLKVGDISPSKAAALLMVGEQDLRVFGYEDIEEAESNPSALDAQPAAPRSKEAGPA